MYRQAVVNGKKTFRANVSREAGSTSPGVTDSNRWTACSSTVTSTSYSAAPGNIPPGPFPSHKSHTVHLIVNAKSVELEAVEGAETGDQSASTPSSHGKHLYARSTHQYMDRRRFLAVVGVALPVSGCLDQIRSPDGDRTQSPDGDQTTRGDRDGTATPTDDSEMVIVLRSATSTEHTATVRLTSDGSTVLERVVTVAPNGETALEAGIDQQGQYELTVAVENGPRETFPFSVDKYDLRAGSNLIATIGEESVEIVIEE